MSSIGSINHLTDLGNGTYQINFKDSVKNKGFVTGDNNVLAPLWYCKAKYKFGTDWNWGTSTYGGGAEFLSNCKIFRMWNPGSTNENFVVELNGWTNGGKCVSENTGEDIRYIFDSYKSTLKAGAEVTLEFEFKDSDPNVANGYFLMWVNGAILASQTALKTRINSGLKRPYIIGLENEWVSSPYQGNNTLTLSDILMIENKTRAQYLGGNPPPPPPPDMMTVAAHKAILATLGDRVIALGEEIKTK